MPLLNWLPLQDGPAMHGRPGSAQHSLPQGPEGMHLVGPQGFAQPPAHLRVAPHQLPLPLQVTPRSMTAECVSQQKACLGWCRCARARAARALAAASSCLALCVHRKQALCLLSLEQKLAALQGQMGFPAGARSNPMPLARGHFLPPGSPPGMQQQQQQQQPPPQQQQQQQQQQQRQPLMVPPYMPMSGPQLLGQPVPPPNLGFAPQGRQPGFPGPYVPNGHLPQDLRLLSAAARQVCYGLCLSTVCFCMLSCCCRLCSARGALARPLRELGSPRHLLCWPAECLQALHTKATAPDPGLLLQELGAGHMTGLRANAPAFVPRGEWGSSDGSRSPSLGLPEQSSMPLPPMASGQRPGPHELLLPKSTSEPLGQQALERAPLQTPAAQVLPSLL